MASAAARVPMLAAGMPAAAIPYLSRGARRRFAELVADARPDTVQIEHSFLAPLVDAADTPAGGRVLSLHNVAAEQYRSIARSARGAGGAVGAVKQRLAARLERSYLPRFDAVVVVSDAEREAVMRLDPAATVTVVENGVDTRRLRPLPRPPRQSVLFVGNLDYAPNEAAARWICEEIAPALRRLTPAAEVRVVGPGGSGRLRRFAARAGVEMAGPAADVVPHYKWSSVCVAPLRAGGGTRLKVLEAMALGRPVVSTPLGAAGLELEPERNVLLAEDAEGLARQVARALADRELWQRLSAEARARVESRYDWDSLGDRLRRLHERLAGG
jgi:glycosyltransferase involved in cell wall biosynthesis